MLTHCTRFLVRPCLRQAAETRKEAAVESIEGGVQGQHDPQEHAINSLTDQVYRSYEIVGRSFGDGAVHGVGEIECPTPDVLRSDNSSKTAQAHISES